MHISKEEGARPIKAWLGTKQVQLPSHEAMHDGEMMTVLDIEDQALQQTKNLARLPFIFEKGIALMPDAHLGKGATVGSVVPTTGAIIPAAVGVDLGCGMNAVRTSLKSGDLPDSLKGIRDAIEKAVPLGKGGGNHMSLIGVPKSDIVYKMPEHVAEGTIYDDRRECWAKAQSQLGSLGSGNHFIELCVDENDSVWVMLHSGSRGIGNMIGSYYIERAKRLMEMYYVKLPDGDMAFLPEASDDFKMYVEAVQWAQDYALENRKVMMQVVLDALHKHVPKEFVIGTEAINCHHNYISRENHFGQNLWVTRKGAIRAREGDLGIIPGSMGQKSYIVRGKGNPDSYCSCSHGAGRAMSRTAAKKRFTLRDLESQTSGVECRKDDDVLDEIPGAYKNLDVVMEHQKDLVEVVHTLKAVMCIKGN